MKQNLRVLLYITITFSLLVGLVYATHSLFPSSSPSSTYHSLDDIYNYIVNNTTKDTPDSSITTELTPIATTSHSTGEIYALLANIPKQEDIKTGTTILGVTGDWNNPNLDYATITPVYSSLTPIAESGIPTSYTLDDIYNLIINNATTTAGAHSFASNPSPSMRSTSDIYDALVSLSSSMSSTTIRTGVTYLGKTGVCNLEGSCTTNTNCPGGYCGTNSDQSAQICTDGESDIDYCTTGTSCASSVCNLTTHLCVSGEVGSPCTSSVECSSGYCDTSNNTCEPLTLTSGLVGYWNFDGDMEPNVGGNKITGWTNGATYGMEDFNFSGGDIITANNSNLYGGVVSNVIALQSSKTYKLTMDISSVSGALPNVRIVTCADGRCAITYSLSNAINGSYEAWFNSDITANRYLEISYGNGVYGAFSISNILLVEYSEATAYDSSSLNNNGTYYGNTYITTTSAFIDNSLKLDGTGDWVVINDNTDFQFDGNGYFTLSTWVNWDGQSSTNKFLSIGEGDSKPSVSIGVNAWTQNDRHIYFYVANSTTAISASSSDYILPYNEWVLITGVRDGTISRLYINGSLVSETSGDAQGMDLSAEHLDIGSQEEHDYLDFKGKLDEVAVWNRALSADEISALYNNGSGMSITP